MHEELISALNLIVASSVARMGDIHFPNEAKPLNQRMQQDEEPTMKEENASLFPDMKKSVRLVLSVIALACLSTLPPKVEAASVPAHFKSYSMTDIGSGLRCIAGDTTNEGSDGRAYVYLVDLTSHKMRWITKIPLPPNRYQNRATHCLADGNKVYAVVQSDTSPSQSLSQTFVDVATLDKSTGQLVSTAKVIAPEAGRAPSTWVDDGANNFRMENGKIVVTGQFFNVDNPDVRKPFIASPTP